MSFNVSEARECVSQYKKIWNEVGSQLFENLASEPMKGEGKYVQCKLKMRKEHIKTNFHVQDILHDIYCNTTVVLKIDSVYKQGKNYHLRYMLKNVNTPMMRTNNVACSAMIMMDFLRCKKNAKKDFFNLPEGYKTNNK